MITRDPQYVRLTRGARSLVRQTSLWLGPDHLLAVHISGFAESYQRFAYRDIQALILRRTPWYLVIAIVQASLLVPALLLAVFSSPEFRIAAAVPATLLGILLPIHLLRGPTCACYLHTAVKTEKLTGLNRVRKARRVIAAVQARVAPAQATP